MSISTSMNAGVAGLNANATRLSTISDNIANSGTYGYKRMQSDFHSMVIGDNAPGTYSAGGVRTTTMRLISERGPLEGTSNPTDLAITGRGFLPVMPEVAVGRDGVPPMMLTTTGSFRPDPNGILRTETGLVLMGWPAAADGTIPSFPRDTVGGLQPVRIGANQFAGNPTTRIEMGVNLPASGTRAGASGEAIELSLEFYDNLGLPGTLMARFEPEVPAAGASNTWTLRLTDPADGDTLIGEYVMEFDDSPATGGQLASVTQAAGAPGDPFDPDTGMVGVTTGAGNVLSLGLSPVGGGNGMTQVSDRFVPGSITRDGSPVGTLVSVEVDPKGMLNAIYDNDFVRTIYQIPVVDVPNPNGLRSMSNQTYGVTLDSGPFLLWGAGDGPTGEISGFVREGSATDVAAELTSMIRTQRAYSSNAKVIQTVDEMLQETTNLKR